MNVTTAAGPGRSGLWFIVLTAAAWTLRECFVLAMQVDTPIQGDSRQYVAYAWNLIHLGTFSQVWPGQGIPVPDAFRGPGYPSLIALAMRLTPASGDWYAPLLQVQVLLGTFTVTCVGLLARHWLSRWWSLAAAALLAIWPHHVVASGVLLGEVLFGFLLMLALLLAAESTRRSNGRWALGAGAAMSCASLTNPVALLLPLVVAAIFLISGRRRLAGILLLAGLAGPAGWGMRGAMIDVPDDGPGRAAINLVQGSWPMYHEAHFQVRRYGNPIAREMLAEMDAEARLLAHDRISGLARIGTRLARDPMHSLEWYLLRKPFLLWDWDIRIGVGDVYFQRVRNSLLETNPVLHAAKQGLKTLNSILFSLVLAGCVLALGASRRRPDTNQAAALVALAALYLTAVHVVFQAEPRYAIAYRGIELMLAIHTLAWGGERLTRLRRTSGTSSGRPTSR